MPTHSLLPFVDCPDGLAQDIVFINGASIPEPGCSMTPHTTSSDQTVLQPGGNASLSCMFCDKTFARQDDLGPHVLAEHPTTSPEPTVLQVEAEFKNPGERPRHKPCGLPVEKEEVLGCILCGHIAQDASELESHVRKHKKYYTYLCKICGRRFKESRYLKNHVKKHPKEGGNEPPVTINDIPQEPSEPVFSPYKMCLACGFFFPDQDSLDKHSKMHNRQVEPDKDEGNGASAQEIFLRALHLKPASSESNLPVRTSRWIPQLNPYVTYQAWKLVTTGKVADGVNNRKVNSASTENEDSASDKDEANRTLGRGRRGQPLKKVAGKERRPQKSAAETHRRPLIPKIKDRPTTCEVCARIFRTYHQLVLHSRVHKREKNIEEGPVSPVEEKQPKAVSPRQEDEGPEEAVEETLASGEEGPDRSKPRSKECNHCGKSFKSSYYLNVHLRTHTGEKPYRCVHCDYAAAQKTSLKYHLQRRHKDQPLELSGRSPAKTKQESDEENPESKRWHPTGGSPDGRFNSVCGKFDTPHVLVKMEYNALSPPDDWLLRYPSPAHLEKVDIKSEISDTPLNLSLTTPASAVSKIDVFPLSCPHCHYTCIYPEVLIIHRRQIHKDKPDATDRSRFRSNTKVKRSTGCPPALDGKDVELLGYRRFTRRTRSPPPPPAKCQKPPVNPPSSQRQAPAPVQDGVQQSARNRKYMMDRMAPLDIGSSIWHPDAARLCLSTPFGSLPQVGHFSEPASKRIRVLAPADTKADSGEKPGVLATPMDGPNRLLMTGMSVRTMPQGAGLPPPSEALGACPPLGAGLDSEWGMMNLLQPYTAGDLAALYHGMSPNPGHAGLATPRAGGGTMLYKHLPSLPNPQRREPAATFPSPRSGSSDKSA